MNMGTSYSDTCHTNAGAPGTGPFDDRARLKALIEVYAATVDLPTQERLLVVQIAWMLLASHARTRGLPFSGGFFAEQKRQLQLLGRMADFVRAETPDLEMESLSQECNFEGLMRYFRDLLTELPPDDEHSVNAGP
jgi:hypothetical protein